LIELYGVDIVTKDKIECEAGYGIDGHILGNDPVYLLDPICKGSAEKVPGYQCSLGDQEGKDEGETEKILRHLFGLDDLFKDGNAHI